MKQLGPLHDTTAERMAARAEKLIPEAASGLPAASYASGLRVLIVDDNTDVTEPLVTLLETWGCVPRVARTGAHAIEVAEEFLPTVVLLDLGLPDRHGYDVAKEIRKRAAGRPLFFVAITGWYQIADQLQSTAAGISHHLVKPVNLAVLKEILTAYQSAVAQ